MMEQRFIICAIKKSCFRVSIPNLLHHAFQEGRNPPPDQHRINLYRPQSKPIAIEIPIIYNRINRQAMHFEIFLIVTKLFISFHLKLPQKFFFLSFYKTLFPSFLSRIPGSAPATLFAFLRNILARRARGSCVFVFLV